MRMSSLSFAQKMLLGGAFAVLSLSAGFAQDSAAPAPIPTPAPAAEEELLSLPPLEQGEVAPLTPLKPEPVAAPIAPAAPSPAADDADAPAAAVEDDILPPQVTQPQPVAPAPIEEEAQEQAQEQAQEEPMFDTEASPPSADEMSPAAPATAPEAPPQQEPQGEPLQGEPLSAQAVPPGEQSVIPHVTWQGSLMFRPSQIENLMTLYNAYQASRSREADTAAKSASGVDVSALLKNIEGRQQKTVADIPNEVLNVTLNSILYYHSGDWSIWINGQRYFRDDALSGLVIGQSTLRVLSASEREVTLLWVPLPVSQDKVKRVWQAKRRAAEEGTTPPSSFIAKDERVWLDDASNVNITLKPNQTFVSEIMSTVEGVNITSAIAQQQPDEPEEALPDAATTPAAPNRIGSFTNAPAAEGQNVPEVTPPAAPAAPMSAPSTPPTGIGLPPAAEQGQTFSPSTGRR